MWSQSPGGGVARVTDVAADFDISEKTGLGRSGSSASSASRLIRNGSSSVG